MTLQVNPLQRDQGEILSWLFWNFSKNSKIGFSILLTLAIVIGLKKIIGDPDPD